MILPKVGESWTGLYRNLNLNFKVINIIPIREFMEIEAARLERDYAVGEGVKYAPMLREKIAAGNYDKYGNVYIIHYSDREYVEGRYNILLESILSKEWENLQQVS